MTRCFILALCAAIASAVSGCACETKRASACVELEVAADAAVDNAISETVVGTRADDDGFDSLGGCDTQANVVTVATNERRVRFSWSHPEVDLAVDVGEDITVEQIETGGLESGFGHSFVLRDEDGIAVAIRSGFGPRTVGDAVVEQGGWRGSGISICGVYHSTGTRISTETESHDVWSGSSIVLDVEGAPLTFHAFAANTFGPWVCTDTEDNVNWALVRGASP